MDRLIVICEGGVHTVEYLHRNGVYPGAMLIEPGKFQEISPYLTKDDDILLIIKGLTDFTMTSIYGLLAKFDEYKDKFKRVTILTNIPLGAVSYDYYLYTGDLFFGSVKKVINKKVYDLDGNGNIVENQKKFTFGKKKDNQKMEYNPIMSQFKKYNNKKVRIMIYGKMSMTEPNISTVFEYEEKVKAVDLYNKENKNENNGGII